MIVRFKSHVSGCVPFRKHVTDAAWDLPCAWSSTLLPGTPAKLSTGIAFELPEGTFGDLRARSSATLRGIHCAGVIDETYRGIVFVLAVNLTSEPIQVQAGDRLAQLIVLSRELCSFRPVEMLAEGERGTAGFGSTGRGA